MCFGLSSAAGSQTELQARPQPLQISNPTGGLQIVPAPQRDSTGRPVRHQDYDLSSEDLQQALQTVADYLDRKRAQITLVAVGGVVSTMLLKTRQSTHDVDFFNYNLTEQNSDLLREASKVAQKSSPVLLGGNWLNNLTTLYIPRALQEELSRAAVAQNDVIFSSSSLTILAAPWQFALCSKIDRMKKPQRRKYDCADAAAYLHCFIQRTGGNDPVPASHIQEMAVDYGTYAPEAQLREVDIEYQRLYHKNGIIF